jgi:hypothetical protein
MRMKLTTRSIEALQPGDKPYEIADTDLKG